MAEATIGVLSTADQAAIRETMDQFTRSLLARDFESLARCYTEDAVLMPPNQPAVRGRTAIRDWMASFPRLSRFTASVEEMDGRADLAYVRGTYRMTLHPEGAPEPIDNVGKYVEIRRRQADGSWLLAADIFNSDEP